MFYSRTVQGLWNLYDEFYTTESAMNVTGSSHVNSYRIPHKIIFHFSQLLFPAVTFCNQNRINCNKLNSTLNDVDNNLDKTTLDTLKALMDQGCVDQSPKKRRRRQTSSDMMGPPGATPSYLEAEYQFLDFFMSLNESVRRSIGHDFPTFIKSCTFRGKDCLNMRLVHFKCISHSASDNNLVILQWSPAPDLATVSPSTPMFLATRAAAGRAPCQVACSASTLSSTSSRTST